MSRNLPPLTKPESLETFLQKPQIPQRGLNVAFMPCMSSFVLLVHVRSQLLLPITF
jgi:hypothetical protein